MLLSNAPSPTRNRLPSLASTATPEIVPELGDGNEPKLSLQLDETISIYTAKILGTPEYLALVNNAHPMLPLATLHAGFRLMLHGLAAEQLHYHLRLRKRQQQAADR